MTTIEPAFENSDIKVAIGRFTSIPEVAAVWRELEARARPSFFLSWTWICTWLESTGVEPVLLSAHLKGRLVGLGLLNRVRRGRMGLKWPAYCLHEVGLPEQDCLMVEDNGFLAEAGSGIDVNTACLRALVVGAPEWRELRLAGVPEEVVSIADRIGLPVRTEARRPSFYVDITVVGDDGVPLSLSANTRQQIRRSVRLYQERGPISLRRSRDVAEALGRFAEMEVLHQRRWEARGKSGAFASPFFGHFHRALLARGFETGEVDVLRIDAGSGTIGFIHTFFHGGDAYAYQNGFNFEQDRRLKPGLVSHILALQHCRRAGMRRYRLLAGDSRYKRSLSTAHYDLYWLSIRRPDLAFQLEQFARWITRRDP